jgi:hypothetical protein
MIATRRTFGIVLSCLTLTALGFATSGCGDKAADAGVDFHSVAINAPVNKQEMPDIPDGAQYTIVCRVFSGEDHVQASRLAQQQLHDETKLKKWYVVHSNDHSTLYYGYYRCINPRDEHDGVEGKRAIDDLNSIRTVADSQGNRLFPESLLVDITAPDPEANPAWDITKTRGTWSIDIADYSVPERKKAAVDSVREMRAHGIEAYYYHGETASSVCIGCWPGASVIEITPEKLNNDPDHPIVVTQQPLPAGFQKQLENQGMKGVAPHVDIVDPTLTAAMLKYPDHATDGTTRTITDSITGKEKVVEKAFLFKIPHPDPLDTMTPDSANANAPYGTPVPAAQPQEPGVGRLRSYGE